jgi:hypothetical protein
MTRARLAAIALAGLCPCHAGAQPREALPCAIPDGPDRQECSAKLWELLTGEKSAIKTTPPAPPGGGGWVVSETTSPVDYSPQVSASTLSRATAEDAPASLTVGCRLQRIEFSVSTAGRWKASGNGQFRVVHRIDQRPAVEERWVAVRDGRAASFKGDALALLQSLPDSGLMSISVFDWQGRAHEAAFRLDGLAAVRQKVLAACKAAPAAERPSAQQRR